MSSPHVQLHVKLSGFQNPESSYLWMLESLALESGMQVPTTNAVFRLERATEVLELTYLGKYFACINAN